MKCECPIAGFCTRRKCEVSEVHWNRCKAGQVALIDAVHSTGATPPTITSSHRRSHPQRASREYVGTALESRIERTLKLKTGKGCGCQKLVDKMNAWGISGCQANRREIIDTLMIHRQEMGVSFAQSAFNFAASMGVMESLKLGTKLLLDLVDQKDIPHEAELAGCNWLLDRAIEDTQTKAVRVRSSSHKSRSNHNFVNIPLIGQPINRERLQSHIIYHIMPLAGDTEWVWRRHCKWLREVRPQFNGRLIIGIVTPGVGDAWEYCSPETVKEELKGLGAEFIEAPNDTGNAKNRKRARQGIGEGVLFPRMLEALQTTDPDQVAFYGHCKGVSRPQATPDSASHIWAEAMFDTVFRNQTEAIAALDTHGVCGSFRMPGGYRDGGPGIGSNWFYSGTFFGIRLVDAFRRKWEYMPTHYGCVEQWPRLNFDKTTQSACLFFDNVNNLYDEAYWQTTITPAFEKWKVDRGTR